MCTTVVQQLAVRVARRYFSRVHAEAVRSERLRSGCSNTIHPKAPTKSICPAPSNSPRRQRPVPGSVSADCSDNSCRPIKALRTGRHLVDTSISSTPASTAQARVASASDGASRPKPKPDRDGATPAAPASSTTVTLSPAVQAAQEAAETPEQTAREARGNDRQAQQLVAKQAAVAKMYAGT